MRWMSDMIVDLPAPDGPTRPMNCPGVTWKDMDDRMGCEGRAGYAKETFLNYFFGQNGPGPLQGATADRAGALGPIVTGRDVTGADPSLEAGIMAGKRGLDSNAAYDMKSLGKHIEAVSLPVRPVRCSHVRLLNTTADV